MDTQVIGEDFAGYIAIESDENSHRHRIYDLNHFLNYICTDSQYTDQTECEDNGSVWSPDIGDIISLDDNDKIHIFGAFNGYEYYSSYGNEYNLGFTLGYSTLDNYDSGDINLDGSINVVDLTSLINFILENTNISEYQFNLIDMNNDTNANIVDVITLVNIILDS